MLDPWPFAPIPDQERASRWVGRPAILNRFRVLLNKWQRRRAADMSVLWSDFGQGKTHSLLFVMSKVRDWDNGAMVHYVQLPPLTSGSPFVALYRQLMRDFPLAELARKVFDRYQTAPLEVFSDPTLGRSDGQVVQALWLVATRGQGSDVATNWLLGERVSPSQLGSLSIGARQLNIAGALKTAQDCQNALDSIITVATMAPTRRSDPVQLIFLVDEFQRIGELSKGKRIEICNAIHLLFNRHPQDLRFLLAFAGGLPEIVSATLTPDLNTRVSSRVDLPPFTVGEAKAYLKDLLADYAVAGVRREGSFYPFDTAGVGLIISEAAKPDGKISPRKINVVCDEIANQILTSREDVDVSLDDQFGSQEITAAVEALLPTLQRALAEGSP